MVQICILAHSINPQKNLWKKSFFAEKSTILGQKSKKSVKKTLSQLHNFEKFSRIFAKPFLKVEKHIYKLSQQKLGNLDNLINFYRKKTLGGVVFTPPRLDRVKTPRQSKKWTTPNFFNLKKNSICSNTKTIFLA